MSIWGKLAAAELLVAGPIAALLGNRAAPDAPHKKPDEHAENDVAFTVGVIALAAKMAKADGVVTKDEVKAFKTAFKVSDAEMKQGARVFNLAKQNVTGYEDCAEQLVIVFKGNRKMLEDVLEGLFHIAKADAAIASAARKSSSARSPSASVFPIASSARSRPATSSRPSAIPTRCSASSPRSAMSS